MDVVLFEADLSGDRVRSVWNVLSDTVDTNVVCRHPVIMYNRQSRAALRIRGASAIIYKGNAVILS